MRLADLETPRLVLDAGRMEANVARLKAHLASLGVRLRPHVKTCKSIEVARALVDSHAGPITVSTLKEAEQFLGHGVTDILYAVGIAPGKLDHVVALRGRGADLCVVVDSVDAARAVAARGPSRTTRWTGVPCKMSDNRKCRKMLQARGGGPGPSLVDCQTAGLAGEGRRRHAMSDRELFAPVSQLQLPAHCGPCSLSACLFVLGTTATQRQLAKASGRPMRVFAHGIDEQGLRRAAGTYGVVSDFLLVEERRQGRAFATRLRRHLAAGNPAIMLVGHFEHWVAVIGYLRRRHRFIIVDPKDKSSVFRLWSEQTLIRRGWNVNAAPATGEPDQFFAIFLARADGGPPRWQVSEAWLRLCERGSDATAEGMANES